MKIALASDWHIGITKEKSIRKALKTIAEEKPDVLVHAGDFCGGVVGNRSVKTISKLSRKYLPDTAIVACLGNHDYWVEGRRLRRNPGAYDHHALTTSTGRPSLMAFGINYQKIIDAFKLNNIHFLDKDGVFRHPDFPGIAIVGHSLWYANPPMSNDEKFLPIGIEGDTHRHLYKKSKEEVLDNLEQLEDTDIVRIFVSHFPVVEVTHDGRGWAGDLHLGDFIKNHYNIDKFLNGHMHQLHMGPIRYEAGSDYENPRFLIIEV